MWLTLLSRAPPCLQETVDRLYHVLRPQAALLAFFHAEEKANLVPQYNYRIVESKTLSLTPRGERKPAQYFNNRSLQNLSRKFTPSNFS